MANLQFQEVFNEIGTNLDELNNAIGTRGRSAVYLSSSAQLLEFCRGVPNNTTCTFRCNAALAQFLTGTSYPTSTSNGMINRGSNTATDFQIFPAAAADTGQYGVWVGRLNTNYTADTISLAYSKKIPDAGSSISNAAQLVNLCNSMKMGETVSIHFAPTMMNTYITQDTTLNQSGQIRITRLNATIIGFIASGTDGINQNSNLWAGRWTLTGGTPITGITVQYTNKYEAGGGGSGGDITSVKDGTGTNATAATGTAASNASGTAAFSAGTSTASGNNSFATGTSNTASGLNAAVFGNNNTAPGTNNFVSGYFNSSLGIAQAVFGKNNRSWQGPTSINDRSGTIFIIGNGINDATRSNALRVDTNGRIFICPSTGTDATQSLQLSVIQEVSIAKTLASTASNVTIANSEIVSATGLAYGSHMRILNVWGVTATNIMYPAAIGSAASYSPPRNTADYYYVPTTSTINGTQTIILYRGNATSEITRWIIAYRATT